MGKRDQRTRHPYDPKKNKGKGPGRPKEANRPPRYEFVMGLADLIAIPNIAASDGKFHEGLLESCKIWCGSYV